MKNNRIKKILLCILITVSAAVCFAPGGSAAFAGETLVVMLDTTYLSHAVVSERPVELQAKLYNSKMQYVYGREFAYQVVSGTDCAEIRDGKIYIVKAGTFSLKTSLADNPQISQTVSCNAYELSFSDIRILSRIENVTVYTQPILLTGTLEVNGIPFPEDIHKAMKYEVVSGNAEIFSGNYLRIKGEGKIVLKASSLYDGEAFILKEIDVADPDKGFVADEDKTFSQGAISGGGSCSSSGGAMSVLLLASSVFALTISRKK